MDLVLNNLQWLVCHETQPNQTKQAIQQFSYFSIFCLTRQDCWEDWPSLGFPCLMPPVIWRFQELKRTSGNSCNGTYSNSTIS